ncbi:hypothetical protein GCM10023346_46850 [Arthrobacter gyeryongensis]|uniref:Uncharacterized protein n=1 Tax=Arthrobacter gyeryongensis TaxID=1650592 RepID=A0ABP9SV29_9MICC
MDTLPGSTDCEGARTGLPDFVPAPTWPRFLYFEQVGKIRLHAEAYSALGRVERIVPDGNLFQKTSSDFAESFYNQRTVRVAIASWNPTYKKGPVGFLRLSG